MGRGGRRLAGATDGRRLSAFLYFDHLPHKHADRALDLALEVLACASEPYNADRDALNDKFMLSLLYAHGAAVIGRSKPRRTKCRAGSGCWAGCLRTHEPFKRRIESIADSKGWRADDLARTDATHPLDCEAMSRAGTGATPGSEAIFESERDPR